MFFTGIPTDLLFGSGIPFTTNVVRRQVNVTVKVNIFFCDFFAIAVTSVRFLTTY